MLLQLSLMFHKAWFASSSGFCLSLQSVLWIVLFFSRSLANLHLISPLPLFFHHSPSFLYYMPFPQSACVLCLSYKLKDLLQLFVPFTTPPSLPPSIRPSLRLTQAFYIYSSGSVRLSLRRLFPDLYVSFLRHYFSPPHVAWQSFFFFFHFSTSSLFISAPPSALTRRSK